ncbi:MAG: acetylornithine deacetylase [Blastocatellia bacterium]|jgi:acetylornithine deacetylase|nr:acetylornithine deacetylase [Blastocatellia bacterium]
MDLFELTRKLIDIPSVSGDEGAATQFLCHHLEGLGYIVETQSVAGERQNVIATTGAPPRVVLSTHTDTVPPYIASSEDADFIHGRGACDAKGIIAAQIFAAEKVRAAGLNEIGLLFTVDEEQASLGARAANDHPLAKESRFLINGEPTDNRLAIGTKGALRVLLKTEGRAAHSAYPEQGESAVEKLLDVLASIRACVWPADELFGETTCNIGIIDGGTRANVIPAHASADLLLRLATDKTQVKKILADAVAGRATLEYTSEHNPVRLRSVEGLKQCVVRFTTDIPYLSNWGAPLLIGPGSILNAHTSHEKVSKSELVSAVELYVKLVKELTNTW